MENASGPDDVVSNASDPIQNQSVKKRLNDSLISEVKVKKEKSTHYLTNGTSDVELISSDSYPVQENNDLIDKPEVALPSTHSSANNTDIIIDNELVSSDSYPVQENNDLIDRPEVALPSTHSANNSDTLTDDEFGSSHLSTAHENNDLLDRPEVAALPESTSFMRMNLTASKLTFGFIGLGNIGSAIVKNLLFSGHKVVIWNRTPDKIKKFKETGAIHACSPSDVLKNADITFSCVSDPKAVKEVVYGDHGILAEMKAGKAYVEMSGIDSDTSIGVSNSVMAKGGRYLEVMIQGSKNEAENRNLVFLAAGDRTVFNDCHSAFYVTSKCTFYLGYVGKACKMNMILNTIKAISLAGLAENMAIAYKNGLSQKMLLDIFESTSSSSPIMAENGKAMVNNNFTTNQALKHVKKDIWMLLQNTHSLVQPCPITAAVNELLKLGIRRGHGDKDSSSLFATSKFG